MLMTKRDGIETALVIFVACCVFVVGMVVIAIHIGAVQF